MLAIVTASATLILESASHNAAVCLNSRCGLSTASRGFLLCHPRQRYARFNAQPKNLLHLPFTFRAFAFVHSRLRANSQFCNSQPFFFFASRCAPFLRCAVMLSLTTMRPDGNLNNPDKVKSDLARLKAAGVDGSVARVAVFQVKVGFSAERSLL